MGSDVVILLVDIPAKGFTFSRHTGTTGRATCRGTDGLDGRRARVGERGGEQEKEKGGAEATPPLAASGASRATRLFAAAAATALVSVAHEDDTYAYEDADKVDE